MSAGAMRACGDVLVFLHADTALPVGFDEDVRQALADVRTTIGAFDYAVAASAPDLRAISWLGRLRSRTTRLPYGDQAIFVRARTFRALGGFPDIPVMEDYEFVRRARRLGRVALVGKAAATSDRSWRAHGLVRPTLVDAAVILGYRLGASPTTLAGWREAVTARS